MTEPEPLSTKNSTFNPPKRKVPGRGGSPISARSLPILMMLVLLLTAGCDRDDPPAEAPAPPAPAAASTPPAHPASSDARVILVVVDTLRADRLTQYGYSLPTSEALSDLFDRATTFTNALAPSPWTTPSTASIHSGLSPFRHGATRMGATLQPAINTLAEAMTARGLKSVGFSYNVHVSRQTGFDQGFKAFLDYQGKTLAYPEIAKMTGYAKVWLKRNGQEPFFLYLHPMSCHGPYRVPRDRADDLLGRLPRRGFAYYGSLMKDIMTRGKIGRRSEVTPRILSSLNERYDTGVRYSMDELGGLINSLKEQGIFDDVTLILTSDHGEELFDHGGFSHGFTLHREVLHVPLIIKLPGQTKARRVDSTVSLMDIYPTLLDLLDGEPHEAGLDGRSLVPLLKGDSEGWEDRTMLHTVDWPRRTVGTALVEGPWKLIHIDSGYDGREDSVELYNIAEDPTETKDLAPARASLAQSMRARLDELTRVAAERALPAPRNVRAQMDDEALKALGYVQ